MKSLPLLLAAFSAACGVAAALPAAAGELLYTLDGGTTRPGTATCYDYVELEPATRRLSVARLADGPIVFDVDTNEGIATVDNSPGANGPLVLSEYKRGYAAMHDSSLSSSDLQTLKPLARKPLATRRQWGSVKDLSSRRLHGGDLQAAVQRTGDLPTAAVDRSSAGDRPAGTRF